MPKITEEDREWAQAAHLQYPQVHSYGFAAYEHWYFYFPPVCPQYTNEWGQELSLDQRENVVRAREFLKQFSTLTRWYYHSPTSYCAMSLYHRTTSTPTLTQGCFILAALGLKIPVKQNYGSHRAIIGISKRGFNALNDMEMKTRSLFDN